MEWLETTQQKDTEFVSYLIISGKHQKVNFLSVKNISLADFKKKEMAL